MYDDKINQNYEILFLFHYQEFRRSIHNNIIYIYIFNFKLYFFKN